MKALNAVEAVDQAVKANQDRWEAKRAMLYVDLKQEWDATPVKHSRVRAEAASCLSVMVASELEGRDLEADFGAAVAKMAQELRQL